jgi:hypothetical protein
MNAELQKVINETIKENPAVAIIMKLAVELQEENGRLKEDKKAILKYYKELCSFNSIMHNHGDVIYSEIN